MKATPPLSARISGFTLVELLIVIVLVGLLAAMALPRLISVLPPARAAKAQAAYGAIRSAATLAKSQCLVGGGNCSAASGSMVMEGVVIPMAYAYPAAGGIQAAATISTHDFQVGGSDPVTFTVWGAAGPCGVRYGSAVAPNTTPEIVLDLSGC